ncbi:Metallo-hydrolase/oxidoreductase [Sphaerulina musiva SO2202]|uniref:Metallo-hydrolase/oxidoreductase n=1 Tax=Sphaerulina musiva (strain SO2202) TaxID=692275 RepID=M3CAI2_SPHMS|nr:Metallo-hydrolase/oxidoreductase [Sphaerulina musiva SO2202]EMF08855.1 Metallo-hydrolase/oxidoreductase [Sphaerulina musiva SO2202]
MGIESLPPLDPITRLSPRVIRILGGNPSKFTLQGTNTHLVGTGSERILIDTAEGLSVWRERLERVLKDEEGKKEGKVKITKVLLTHWHHDHVGGVDDVRDLLGEDGVEVWKDEKKKKTKIHKIKPNQTFSVPGAHLTAIFTPGHTSDHMSFFLREEDALFAGDNVLGHGTAVFEDLKEYMESLERMQKVAGGRVYPSHGEVVEDGLGKIGEYIAHRRQREMEALEVLGRKEGGPGGDGWWGSMEMVKVVYAAYPEEYWGPAEGSLKQVLKKLERDGKVRQGKGRDGEDGKWALIEKSAL